MQRFFLQNRNAFVLETVAADGSISLPCVPGVQRVEVIDLATRVPLAVADGIEVAAGAAMHPSSKTPA